jgi:hypothetical protein
MDATLLVNIDVANGLHVHGNDVSFQQLKSNNLHPQPNGEPLGGSPNGRSLGRRLFYQDPLGRSPVDAPIGFNGWLALDSRMFMPPWYTPIVV